MHSENLMELFELSDLSDLLDRTAQALSQIGFQHVTLQWCPAPAPVSTMISNSQIVWHNLDLDFQGSTPLLCAELTGAIAFHLD